MSKAFKRISSDTYEQNRLQDNIGNALDPLILKELTRGRLQDNVEFTLGTNLRFEHGLDRVPRGFMVVNHPDGYRADFIKVSSDKRFLILSPQIYSDWAAYTPTLTNFSATNSDWLYRHCGDSIDVTAVCRSLTVTGTMEASIPITIEIDFAKLPHGWSRVGTCGAFDSSLSDHWGGGVETNNSHATNLVFTDVTGAFGGYDATHPMTWAASDEFKLEVRGLPVKTLTKKCSIWVF